MMKDDHFSASWQTAVIEVVKHLVVIMRHFFPGGGTHDGRRSYCRDLTAQSNFTWYSYDNGLFLTLAAISTMFPGIS